MRVVIDEYGGVAGLVTIEDLLEAIVGSIADEHDEAEEGYEPVRDADGTFVVPGSFEVSRLRELFADTMDDGRGNVQRVPEDGEPSEEDEGEALEAGLQRPPLYLPQHYEATTLGGLVTEIAGHIPHPGEVVEQDGLRLEVLESTDRKVERVRVGLAEKGSESAS
jgi:putative hemolysin